MTFREPAVLLGLALLPVAMLAYLAMQGRRRREAAAFGNPALLPDVVTARPGWRRHVPRALLLLALGRADPRRRAAAAQRRRAAAGGDRRARQRRLRLDARRRRRADRLDRRGRVGEGARRQDAEELPPRPRHVLRLRAAARRADDRPRRGRTARSSGWTPTAATAMGDGLARGLQAAQTPVPTQDGKGTRKLPAIMVLLSDGKQHARRQRPARDRPPGEGREHPVFAIALGTDEGEVVQQDPFGFVQRIPVPPDKETLRDIARTTGGRFFEAVTRGRRRGHLRPHRHAADVAPGAARGHRRVRRRRVRAAARRRRALARLVRPPAASLAPLGERRRSPPRRPRRDRASSAIRIRARSSSSSRRSGSSSASPASHRVPTTASSPGSARRRAPRRGAQPRARMCRATASARPAVTTSSPSSTSTSSAIHARRPSSAAVAATSAGAARRVDDELRAGPVAGLERTRAEQREGAVGIAQQRAARTEQGPVEVDVDAAQHPASVTGSDGRRP